MHTTAGTGVGLSRGSIHWMRYVACADRVTRSARNQNMTGGVWALDWHQTNWFGFVNRSRSCSIGMTGRMRWRSLTRSALTDPRWLAP